MTQRTSPQNSDYWMDKRRGIEHNRWEIKHIRRIIGVKKEEVCGRLMDVAFGGATPADEPF